MTYLRLFISCFLLLSTGLFPEETEEKESAPMFPVERFLSPGIITYQGGQWIGSDHLFNIPNHMDVIVELIFPENARLPFDQEMVRQEISAVLKDFGIQPVGFYESGKPPLPFFHFAILAHPIENGYSASLTGRLFEQVMLPRVSLERGTYLQGIMWERQNLIVSSMLELKMKVFESITEMTKEFGQTYQYYEKLKKGG